MVGLVCWVSRIGFAVVCASTSGEYGGSRLCWGYGTGGGGDGEWSGVMGVVEICVGMEPLTSV